jgi:hypothetical protein
MHAPAVIRIQGDHGPRPAAQAEPPAPSTATTVGAMTGTQHAPAAVASPAMPTPPAASIDVATLPSGLRVVDIPAS